MKLEFSDTWNFVEKYLPDYYNNDEVLYIDICYRYLSIDREDMEEDDLELIERDFNNDEQAIREYLEEAEKRLFLEACEHIYDNFDQLEEQQNGESTH